MLYWGCENVAPAPRNQFNLKMHSIKILMQPQMNEKKLKFSKKTWFFSKKRINFSKTFTFKKRSVYKKRATYEKHSTHEIHPTYKKRSTYEILSTHERYSTYKSTQLVKKIQPIKSIQQMKNIKSQKTNSSFYVFFAATLVVEIFTFSAQKFVTYLFCAMKFHVPMITLCKVTWLDVPYFHTIII